MKHIKAEEIKKPFRIAIVRSLFNREITDKLLEGALTLLKKHDWPEDKVTVVDVPGAVEIPMVALRIAEAKSADCIVALGAVIQGDTNHYDYVCDQVSMGCQRVMLDKSIPVIFGVLTTQTEEQAWERVGGAHGHKGEESIQTAFDLHSVLERIESIHNN